MNGGGFSLPSSAFTGDIFIERINNEWLVRKKYSIFFEDKIFKQYLKENFLKMSYNQPVPQC